MAEEEVIEQEEEGEDMGTIILMLGLYLIVLAFFILLNAISESSREKRDLVVESVREGFDFREDRDNVGSGLDEVSMIPLYESIIEDIEGVIQAYLAFNEYSVEKQSERMIVSLDTQRFFRPGEYNIIPEMILFFESLAGVLKTPKTGMGISTQIIVQADENDLGDALNEDGLLELAGRRSSLFTRALVDEGVDPLLISAGAQKDATKIKMIFEIYIGDYEAALVEAAKLQGDLQNVLEGQVIPTEDPAFRVEEQR